VDISDKFILRLSPFAQPRVIFEASEFSNAQLDSPGDTCTPPVIAEMDEDEIILNESLWEEGSGRLRVELLVNGGVDDYTRYRSALTRHKDNLYADLVRRVSGSSTVITVENGVVKAFKYQIANPHTLSQLEVFKDRLIVHSSVRGNEFEKSMRLRHPIFVMTFIISPRPCNLPLGMYIVEGPLTEDSKSSWRLVRHEDVYTTLLVPTSEGSQEAHVGVPDPPVQTPVHATTMVGDSRRPAHRCGSIKFSHNGDDFDSMLECIHREAFRRMGLRYLVTRNSFQIGHLLSEQTQRMYTTDGILYASVGTASAPLQVFHVEVKPGPLTVEEGERCKALCQFLNQNVLCVCGGNVSDKQLSEESALPGPCTDYGQRPRFRPCVEMCLYAPQGIDAVPLLYPTIVWHSDGRAAPFLSVFDNANPRQKEEARLRLLLVYNQATRDATKFSRRTDPY